MTAETIFLSGGPLLQNTALRKASSEADMQFESLYNPHYIDGEEHRDAKDSQSPNVLHHDRLMVEAGIECIQGSSVMQHESDYYQVVAVEIAAVGKQEAETNHSNEMIEQDCFPDYFPDLEDDLDGCSLSTCLPAMSKIEADRIEGTTWNPPTAPEVLPLPTRLMWVASSMSSNGNTPQHLHGQDTQEQVGRMCSALNTCEANEVAADSESAVSDGLSNDNPEDKLRIVMLQNIPCGCGKKEIMKLLHHHGWADKCNYLHIPRPKRPRVPYAFVGFADTESTRQFMQDVKGKQFPGHESSKALSVAPARLQQVEGSAHATRKKIKNKKDKKQAKTEKVPGSPTTHYGSEGYENMQGTKSWHWNPLQAAPLQDMRSAAYWSKFKQQAYNAQEVAMQVAGAGSFCADAQWYGCSAGFAGPRSMQSTTENDHWSLKTNSEIEIDPWISHFNGMKENDSQSLPIDITTKHVVEQAGSEVSSLSMEFEDVEEAGSEREAAAQRQDNSDSSFEFKDIEEEAAVAPWYSEDSHHGAAVESRFYDAHSEEEEEEEEEDAELLTVMLKNIPCRCSQQDVLDLLAERGWEDAYNFFYLPMPRSGCKNVRGCLGYAFVGFPDSEKTHQFMDDMKGVTFPNRKSTKVIDVVPARYQGLEHNLVQVTGKKLIQSARAPIYGGDDGFQNVIATMRF